MYDHLYEQIIRHLLDKYSRLDPCSNRFGNLREQMVRGPTRFSLQTLFVLIGDSYGACTLSV